MPVGSVEVVRIGLLEPLSRPGGGGACSGVEIVAGELFWPKGKRLRLFCSFSNGIADFFVGAQMRSGFGGGACQRASAALRAFRRR